MAFQKLCQTQANGAQLVGNRFGRRAIPFTVEFAQVLPTLMRSLSRDELLLSATFREVFRMNFLGDNVHFLIGKGKVSGDQLRHVLRVGVKGQLKGGGQKRGCVWNRNGLCDQVNSGPLQGSPPWRAEGRYGASVSRIPCRWF